MTDGVHPTLTASTRWPYPAGTPLLILEGLCVLLGTIAALDFGTSRLLGHDLRAIGFLLLFACWMITVGRILRERVLETAPEHHRTSASHEKRLLTLHVRVFAVKVCAVVAILGMAGQFQRDGTLEDFLARLVFALLTMMLIFVPGGRLPRPSRGEV